MKRLFPPQCRLFCVFFVLLSFISCAARINGPLKEDGSAELTVRASLEPRMAALVRALSAAAGLPADRPVLDGQAIARSMSAAPGIAAADFRNASPAVIEGPVRVSKIGDFLAGGSDGGFISFEQGRSGGRCLISLNRETGPRLLSLISPEIAGYLEALMAPLATGESLTRAEYLALVGTVYGKGIADEISQSIIRVSVDFPGPVQNVRGGTFSGSHADFTIPLPDILVLESPLSYEIAWK